MAELRVGIKRCSLEGIAEGFDESCFALIAPATYDDIVEIDETDFSSLSKRQQVDFQHKSIKKHFVAGKIKAWNGEGFELIDMTAEHAIASRDIADHIYGEIMGFDLDPKAIREVVAESNVQTNEPDSIETPSSEESPESPNQ